MPGAGLSVFPPGLNNSAIDHNRIEPARWHGDCEYHEGCVTTMRVTLQTLYGQPGYALGQGPFHIKGFAYEQHQAWVHAHLPGGLEAQRAALGRYSKDPFFETVFFANAMYDVFPLVLLGHACADVMKMSSEDFVRMRARRQAEQDIRYIRKWIVKLASPSAIARRLPTVLTGYFDFGNPGSTLVEHGVDTRVDNVPAVLSSWLIASCEGFAAYALEVNGAKNVHVQSLAVARADERHGFPLADIEIKYRWN